jgi:hypothetical protein
MSCLFIALGKLTNHPHQFVRHHICNYMQNNLNDLHEGMTIRDWIKWHENTTSEAYIQTMRNTSTWGGAMEIAIATKLYRCDIVVTSPSGKQLAEFIWNENKSARNRLFIYWTGNHYEPCKRVIR